MYMLKIILFHTIIAYMLTKPVEIKNEADSISFVLSLLLKTSVQIIIR